MRRGLWIALILSAVFSVLSVIFTAIVTLLTVTSSGRITFDESAPALGAGICVGSLAIIGLIMSVVLLLVVGRGGPKTASDTAVRPSV